MRRPDHIGIAFTDLLFNALLSFVVMFVLAVLLINPVAKSGAVDPKAEFLITLTWPEGRREDVDLYVEDPAGELVWFRSREAGLMHLDRDDLGERNDMIEVSGRRIANPLNQETVSIRGILPGRVRGEPPPLPRRRRRRRCRRRSRSRSSTPRSSWCSSGRSCSTRRATSGPRRASRSAPTAASPTSTSCAKKLVPLRRLAADPSGAPS